MPTLSATDQIIQVIDQSLRTVWGRHHAARPLPTTVDPAAATSGESLSEPERRLAGALMRVNHVGEVCAQALYTAQAQTTADPAIKAQLEAAAAQERDHLAWTEHRLAELGDRPSLLNPLWYAGSFALGMAAGRLGEGRALGFVIETERQVEAHLRSHLGRLPAADGASRAIVAQMRADEAEHAEAAQAAGGVRPPRPVRWLMQAAAKVMTATAHHV